MSNPKEDVFFLGYGGANLGSWDDLMNMHPDMRRWFVDRLKKQQDAEAKKMKKK